MHKPSQSVKGTASTPTPSFWSTFTLTNVFLWALLSSVIHIGIHVVSSIEYDGPERSALAKEIQKNVDTKYELELFYKWMIKEVKKDAAKGEKVIARQMNWHKETGKRFSERLSWRMAHDVAEKLRTDGLDAKARKGNVIVYLD